MRGMSPTNCTMAGRDGSASTDRVRLSTAALIGRQSADIRAAAAALPAAAIAEDDDDGAEPRGESEALYLLSSSPPPSSS